MRTIMIIAGTLLLTGCVPVVAETPPEEPEAAQSGATVEWDEYQEAHLTELLEEHEADAAVLRRYKEEGLGWGELGIALDLAEEAQTDPEAVLEARASGHAWSAIAKSQGVDLSAVLGRDRAVEVTLLDNRPMSELLAMYYEIPEERIVELRGDDLRWEDLQIAIEASRRIEVTVEALLARYRGGEGWGDLARELGFSVPEIMRAVNNPFKATEEPEE